MHKQQIIQIVFYFNNPYNVTCEGDKTTT